MEEGLETTSKLATLQVPNTSTVGHRGLATSHGPAGSQSHTEPLQTDRARLLLKPEPLDSFTPPLHLEEDFVFTETSSPTTDFKHPWMRFCLVTMFIYDKHLS